MCYEIDISSRTTVGDVDLHRIRAAVIHGLTVEQVAGAVLSITIVDNPTIHRLNQEHLNHDFPTDVISFQLEWNSPTRSVPQKKSSRRSAGAFIEGEIIVSVDYAAEMAERCGWDKQSELTLYAIHGMLHICGYDDLTTAEKEIMRSREKAVLGGLGLVPIYPDDSQHTDEPPRVGEPLSDDHAEERQ